MTWEIVNTNAGYQIRMPHPRSPTGTFYGATVAEKDTAILIHAAPDMLEALEGLDLDSMLDRKAADAVRAAIAKARGAKR